jgi:hypothetical protein
MSFTARLTEKLPSCICLVATNDDISMRVLELRTARSNEVVAGTILRDVTDRNRRIEEWQARWEELREAIDAILVERSWSHTRRKQTVQGLGPALWNNKRRAAISCVRLATSSCLKADFGTLAASQVAGRSSGQNPHATLDVEAVASYP